MKSKDMNDPIILNKRYQLNALLNPKNWKKCCYCNWETITGWGERKILLWSRSLQFLMYGYT